MRISLKLIFSAALAASFASIASAATQEVPADQGSSIDTGKIIFYRPSSAFGLAMRPAIIINGEKIGKSMSGKRFTVEVPVGTYQIEIPNTLYSGERTLEVKVQSGESVYIKTSIGGSAFGGRTNVEQIDAIQGEREAEKLKDVNPEGG